VRILQSSLVAKLVRSQYFLALSCIDVMALESIETLQGRRTATGHIRKLGATSLVWVAGGPIRAPKFEPKQLQAKTLSLFGRDDVHW